MAVKNDWIYFILTKLLAMVFVAGILWERYRCFQEKERLKRQKIAKWSFYFEFQVVVAVVGFSWH